VRHGSRTMRVAPATCATRCSVSRAGGTIAGTFGGTSCSMSQPLTLSMIGCMCALWIGRSRHCGLLFCAECAGQFMYLSQNKVKFKFRICSDCHDDHDTTAENIRENAAQSIESVAQVAKAVGRAARHKHRASTTGDAFPGGAIEAGCAGFSPSFPAIAHYPQTLSLSPALPVACDGLPCGCWRSRLTWLHTLSRQRRPGRTGPTQDRAAPAGAGHGGRRGALVRLWAADARYNSSAGGHSGRPLRGLRRIWRRRGARATACVPLHRH
jgi:hypothetical protein